MLISFRLVELQFCFPLGLIAQRFEFNSQQQQLPGVVAQQQQFGFQQLVLILSQGQLLVGEQLLQQVLELAKQLDQPETIFIIE